MYQVLLIAYLLIAIALVGFILVQQGKGANTGASFGNGASGTVFGARGAGNFLSHSTAVLATAFFIISVLLGNLNSNHGEKVQGKFDNLSQVAEQVQQQKATVPAAPAAQQKNSDIPQ